MNDIMENEDWIMGQIDDEDDLISNLLDEPEPEPEVEPEVEPEPEEELEGSIAPFKNKIRYKIEESSDLDIKVSAKIVGRKSKKSTKGTPFIQFEYNLIYIIKDNGDIIKLDDKPLEWRKEWTRHYISDATVKSGMLNQELRKLGFSGESLKDLLSDDLIGKEIILRYYKKDNKAEVTFFNPEPDIREEEMAIILDGFENVK